MARLNTQVMTAKQVGPWRLLLTFPYNEAVIHDLKQLPGNRYAPEVGRGYWQSTVDLLPQLREIASVHQLTFNAILSKQTAPTPLINSELYPFQIPGIMQALINGSHLFNDEMGLGKSAQAIETTRLSGAKSTLIICPAIVRLNWQDELKKWWPGCPDSLVIDSGAVAEEWTPDIAPIAITSYELLPRLPAVQFDSIIVDESHYISNGRVVRSKAVRKVLDYNPDAQRSLLTATMITNEVKGAYYQLDSLHPGRWGTFWQFVKRYSNVEETQYTKYYIHGIQNAEELAERLTFVSSRVTKHEVAHLLPPFTVQTMRVKAERRFNPRELLEQFTRMDLHNNNPDTLIRAAGEQKVAAAIEHALDARESGTSHVAVLTHLRATAHEITAALKEKYTVFEVTGDEPPKERMRIIQLARDAKEAFLVCTMHSVNVGIDLTKFSMAIFAELDYTPANMIQALGRFSRLSGKVPSTVLLLVLEGTQDELIAARLQEKIGNINAMVRGGQAETSLEKTLAAEDESEEDFLAGLREAAKSKIEGEWL